MVVKVTDSETQRPVEFSSVCLASIDSVLYKTTTDMEGLARLPHMDADSIKVSSFGYLGQSLPYSRNMDLSKCDTLTFLLTPDPAVLSELTVIGRNRMTSVIEGGFSYNMSKNERAQAENLLDAMQYVPFMSLSADGSLSLGGSSGFSIYLNGRPYDIAQQNPTDVLRSIPAGEIARIEVITEPNERFGSLGQPIVNIITKKRVLEGFSVNVGGMGATRPDAAGNILFMATRGNVEAAVSYNYDLNGQRGQKMESVTRFTDHGKETGRVVSDGTGSGDWHSHVARLMLKWRIDSINDIYADVHGLLRHTVSRNDWHQEYMPESGQMSASDYGCRTDYNDGSVESNVVYRNYFRSNPEKERFSAGYRYTYTPDKRTVYQSLLSDAEKQDYIQKTSGGMSEHTLNAAYAVMLPARQTLRFNARGVLRDGNTRSYSDNPLAMLNPELGYRQGIGAAEVSYIGIFGRVGVGVWLRGEYAHVDMRLPHTPEYDSRRNAFNFLPSVSVNWIPDRYTSVSAYVSNGIARPLISQLNPFRTVLNEYTAFEGNPDLRAMTTTSVGLSVLRAFGDFSIKLGGRYSVTRDKISGYEYAEGEKTVSTYGNIGKSCLWSVEFNLDWQPVYFLSLSANGDFGRRRLVSSHLDARQYDWIYNITPHADFLLPLHWRIGGQYGIYRSEPDFFQKTNAVSLYSFYVSKSFLDGDLSVSARIQNPFGKYISSRVSTYLVTQQTEQTNHVIGRTFSISLSYTFGSGRSIRLRRDRSLGNKDLESGID